MIRTIAFSAAIALFAIPAGAENPSPKVHKVIVKKTISANGTTGTVVADSPVARAIVAGCGERRFEAQAEVDDGTGHKRVTKIKLCAKPGEDDAAWLRTLRQARGQVAGLAQLPATSRTKLAADFDAEIARVGAAQGGTAIAPVPAPVDPALVAGPPK